MSSSVQFSGESKLVTPIRQSMVMSFRRQVASITTSRTLQHESQRLAEDAISGPAQVAESEACVPIRGGGKSSAATRLGSSDNQTHRGAPDMQASCTDLTAPIPHRPLLNLFPVPPPP